VNLYEGCGRVKLFWLLALVDSNTFKGVVEFREKTKYVGATKSSCGLNKGLCRFCGRADDSLTQQGTCYDQECLVRNADRPLCTCN
jgi:E3 ubiquitin-protein ligase MYCBP2